MPSGGRNRVLCAVGGVIASKVSKSAKIRNQYNQVPHLTQDTNGKVTNSHIDTTNESQEVSPQVTTKLNWRYKRYG